MLAVEDIALSDAGAGTSYEAFWSAIVTTAPILALAVLLEGRWAILREREKADPSLFNLRVIALLHGVTVFALGWSTLNATLELAFGPSSTFLRISAVASIFLAVGVLISVPAGPFLTLGFAGLRPWLVVTRLRIGFRMRMWKMRRRLRRLGRRQRRMFRKFVVLANGRRSDRMLLLLRSLAHRITRNTAIVSLPPAVESQDQFDAWMRLELMDLYRQTDVDLADLHYLEQDMARGEAIRKAEDRKILREAVERESKRLARFIDEPPEVWLSAHDDHRGDGQSTGRGGQR